MLSFSSPRALTHAVVLALAAAGATHAQTPASVDPQRLVALLPSAWSGVKCGKPEAERTTMAVSESSASFHCKGTPESGHSQFEASLTVKDLGATGSKYYAQAARYLREDTASDSTHVVKLADGRRAEYVAYTKDSMSIDTYIAPRLVARASCINSTEVECKTALERFDFKKLEAFQP